MIASARNGRPIDLATMAGWLRRRKDRRSGVFGSLARFHYFDDGAVEI